MTGLEEAEGFGGGGEGFLGCGVQTVEDEEEDIVGEDGERVSGFGFCEAGALGGFSSGHR